MNLGGKLRTGTAHLNLFTNRFRIQEKAIGSYPLSFALTTLNQRYFSKSQMVQDNEKTEKTENTEKPANVSGKGIKNHSVAMRKPGLVVDKFIPFEGNRLPSIFNFKSWPLRWANFKGFIASTLR